MENNQNKDDTDRRRKQSADRLAALLKRFIAERNLTQTRIARMFHISKAKLSLILAGKYTAKKGLDEFIIWAADLINSAAKEGKAEAMSRLGEFAVLHLASVAEFAGDMAHSLVEDETSVSLLPYDGDHRRALLLDCIVSRLDYCSAGLADLRACGLLAGGEKEGAPNTGSGRDHQPEANVERKNSHQAAGLDRPGRTMFCVALAERKKCSDHRKIQ